MDAVAKAPWMGLRRVSEAHKALSLHLTNSCYKGRPKGYGVGADDLPAQDALAEPPPMGLRRVIGISLHLTNSRYKVRPEGCGVGADDLPAQDALAEPPWMGLRRVIGTYTASLTLFAGTKKPANKRALSKLTITQGLVILVKLFFDTCRFT